MKIIWLLIYAVTSGDVTMSPPVQIQQKDMATCEVQAKLMTRRHGILATSAYCVEGWES